MNAEEKLIFMQTLANEKNGFCLSKEYRNESEKLKWQCQKGHVWDTAPYNIKRGSWCPTCAGRNQTIQDMRNVANERGGECLSEEYVNAKTKLEWKCNLGHTWTATPDGIKNNKRWCPTCATEESKQRLEELRRTQKNVYTIKDMQTRAKEKFGECLSEKYLGLNAKLKWKCKDGHVWDAIPNLIKRGSWCPMCNRYLNEEKVRHIFKEIFEKDFPKDRQKIGNQYELDGYNEELNLAFEYNGIQHYEYVPFFHKTHEYYQKRVEQEEEKIKMINELGITLIVIPYYSHDTDNELITFVKNELTKNNVFFKNKTIYFEDFYKKNSTLDELKDFAKKKKGDCLSTEYLGCSQKIKWQCELGHEWEATPSNVKRGRWCPTCARNKAGQHLKLTIAEMKKIAKERKGNCLSEEYKNNRTKLRWQCELGHEWEATPAKIKKGTWCPTCANFNRSKKEILQKKT